MKKICQKFFILFYLLSFQTLFSQVPPDFLLIADAGGDEVWEDFSSLRIDALGNGTFAEYDSRDIFSEQTALINFTLTNIQMNEIWQAINDNSFFSLNSTYEHSTITGRTFARLSIYANGGSKQVVTRNIPVAQFDNIVNSINEKTPAGAKLIYDISTPPEIFFNEPCSNPGVNLMKHFSGKHKFIEKEINYIKPDMIASSLSSHPGTSLGCDLSIEEAVDKGIVELTSKGEFEGDAVSIKVNNSTPQECNELTLKLALEFYGENASAVDALRILNAIQEGWEGYTTTEGKNLTVLVDVKISEGSTEPPGTPGYHQIELVDDAARSHVDEIIEVNQSTGSGQWERNAPDKVYAHEAGHLMGLDDQYDEYRKQPDGTFKKDSDGEIVTAEELAHRVDAEDPTDRTYEEILQKIQDPDRTNGTVPKPGHWDDLMANTKGAAKASQIDVDDIAADPGLIVEVPAGSTFINESPFRQNMASTRNDFMYTGPGETRQLNGLFATCIDGHESVPSENSRFDLGPHLSKWKGIESASTLLKLLNYIDKQRLFCENSIALYAVWRISDNFYPGDQLLNAFFTSAGIEPTNAAYDFPRMDNPIFPDGATSNVIPRQLFVSKITPSPAIVEPGNVVSLLSSFSYPANTGSFETSAAWTLDIPEGSSAELSNTQGESTSVTADIRGIYESHHTVRVTGLGTAFNVNSKGGIIVAADEWTETFETGLLNGNTNIGWSTSGDIHWKISEFLPHSGSYCVESGTISDSQQTVLQVNIVVPTDGEISFAYKVSSQIGDSLFLLIDDSNVKSWANSPLWEIETIPVTAGNHTISWIYKKDESGSGGDYDKAWLDNIFFPPNSVLTSVEKEEILISDYKLEQNYPNPFNPSTVIKYNLPEYGFVTLKIYDVLGREISTLVNKELPAGRHEVIFDASNLSSGVYFYRLQTSNFVETKKMLLMK